MHLGNLASDHQDLGGTVGMITADARRSLRFNKVIYFAMIWKHFDYHLEPRLPNQVEKIVRPDTGTGHQLPLSKIAIRCKVRTPDITTQLWGGWLTAISTFVSNIKTNAWNFLFNLYWYPNLQVERMKFRQSRKDWIPRLCCGEVELTGPEYPPLECISKFPSLYYRCVQFC